MYAVAYISPGGFGSVGYLADFGSKSVRVADPFLGYVDVPHEECFAVIDTEGGAVLPAVSPTLIPGIESTHLQESQSLAANRGEVIPLFSAKEELSKPRHGGAEFVSGYPLAWAYVRRWRDEVAIDWRTIALCGLFARVSIQRPIEEAEMLYRLFGPTVRDMMSRPKPPSAAQMRRLRGIKGTRAATGGHGLDDARSFEDIIKWSRWVAQQSLEAQDYGRSFRDDIVEAWAPWGLGTAKVSFTLALSGHDCACIDIRMLRFFLGGYEDDMSEVERDAFEKRRAAFESAVNARSRKKSTVFPGATGMTTGAVKKYSGMEDALSETTYWDPDWPMPYAKAQWMLWETLGRTAGTANHHALWSVIEPLMAEI